MNICVHGWPPGSCDICEAQNAPSCEPDEALCGNVAESAVELQEQQARRMADIDALNNILRAEKADAELAALRAELQKVRSAAISGMDAATQHGRGLVQQAAKLRAESNPDALESERAANAMLTEQLQKAEAERDAANRRSEHHHQEHLAANREIDRLRAERDALRAWGEEAPHKQYCPWHFWQDESKCTCGKRAALGER